MPFFYHFLFISPFVFLENLAGFLHCPLLNQGSEVLD